jgi:AraC-like DNA-binding protein
MTGAATAWGRTTNHRYGVHPRGPRVEAYGFSTDDTADPVLREMRHVAPTYRRVTPAPFRCTLAGVGRFGIHFELETLEGDLWGELDNPDDCMAFMLPRESTGTKVLGAPLPDHAFALGPGYVFAGTSPGFTFSGVDIHGETLERLVAAAGVDRTTSPWLQPEMLPLASPESRAITTLLDDLADAIAADPLRLAEPRLFAQLEHDFTDAARALLASAAPAGFGGMSHSGRVRLAYRAKDLLIALARNDCDRSALGDLCSALGTTERTLQAAFTEQFGTGFREMDRTFRLQAAHEALLAEDGVASVTEVATRFGFWHLGRFSAYYKAMFGRLPSDTWRASHGERSGPRTIDPGGDA